jgi:hypothetical protein
VGPPLPRPDLRPRPLISSRFSRTRILRLSLLCLSVALMLVSALLLKTVPHRIELYRISREAEERALLYSLHNAFLEYKIIFGSYPANLEELKKLPGRKDLGIKGTPDSEQIVYKVFSDLADLDLTAPRQIRRRSRVKNSSTTGSDLNATGLSLTNYELTWAGQDRIMGTADDCLLRDGAILDSSQFKAINRMLPP